MPYSLSQLRQFVAVAEERSFTGAAAKLHVAQPWLSTRVRQLEATIGFSLLNRSPRGVGLTDAGRLFFEGAKAVLRESAALDTLVGRIVEGAGSTLRLGAIVQSFYIHQRNDLLDSFQAAHPDLHIQLENHSDPDLRTMIERGELDAAFITGPPPQEIEAICLREGRSQLLIPADHPLAALDAVPLASLRGERIGTFPRAANPAAWDASAAPLQAAGAQLEILADGLRDALTTHARRTRTMALMLSSFSDWDNAIEGMCVRPIADETLRADFSLVRRQAKPADRALDRFWHFAQTFVSPSPSRGVE